MMTNFFKLNSLNGPSSFARRGALHMLIQLFFFISDPLLFCNCWFSLLFEHVADIVCFCNIQQLSGLFARRSTINTYRSLHRTSLSMAPCSLWRKEVLSLFGKRQPTFCFVSLTLPILTESARYSSWVLKGDGSLSEARTRVSGFGTS
jgi:hypothetical protein